MRQVVIYADQDDGGWIAEVPSLPGCISQGDTREEVLRNIREAIETWVDGAQQVGMKVPDETFDFSSTPTLQVEGVFFDVSRYSVT